jgi:hypothetical protein
MPYVGEPINRGTGMLLTGRGLLTGLELIQSGESRFSQLQSLQEITHYLVDLTQVVSIEVTIDELLKVGEIDKRAAETIKVLFVAIVAPTHLIDYLARIYMDLSSPKGWTIQLFTRRVDAEAWLTSVVPIANQ